MCRVETRIYHDKSISVIDFSDLKAPEVPQIIQEARDFLSKQAKGSVLSLTDLTRMSYDADTIGDLKEYVTQIKPYLKAAAIIRGDGILKIVVGRAEKSCVRHFASFNTRPEALEWLAQI